MTLTVLALVGIFFLFSDKDQRADLWSILAPRPLVIFAAGMVAATMLDGLYQDIIGKAAYVRMAQNDWVSGWWTIPVEVICIVVAGWYVIKQARREATPLTDAEVWRLFIGRLDDDGKLIIKDGPDK